MEYNIREKSVPLTFLEGKIILRINNNIRDILFQNDVKSDNEEIVIIFLEDKNKDKILKDIFNEDFKVWLNNRFFDLDSLDELEMEEKGCKIKIINKKLKLKHSKLIRNSIKPNTVVSNTTLIGFKYGLTKELNNIILSKVQEDLSKTMKGENLENVQQKETSQKKDTNKLRGPNPRRINNDYNPNQNNNNFIQQIPNQNIQQNLQFNGNNQFNNMNNNFNNNNYNIYPQNNYGQINSQNNYGQMNPQNNYGQMNLQNNYGQMNLHMNMNSNPIMMPNIKINQMTPMNMNQFQMNQMQMNQMQMNQFQMNPFQMNQMQINPMQMMNNMNFNFNNNNMGMGLMNNINNNFNPPSMPLLSLNNKNWSDNYDQNLEQKEKDINKTLIDSNPFTKGIIFPHPAGLMNVGQSCYMNATIECLSNIKSLAINLLMAYGSYEIGTQPLLASFSSLLFDLFHTKKEYIEPRIFKKIIGKLNPLFEGDHAADAKDLIFFIIETLHKEKLGNSKNNNNNEIDFLHQEMISTNEQLMFEDFIKEFELNRTFVSDIFYGINSSVMKCNKCGTSKYSFQTYNLLIFPLKKVKEYKIRKFGKVNNLDLNLYDAFLCEQEEEKLEGENMIYCNRCKQLSPGLHKQDVYGLPRILIIILNRGRNNQDFNEAFRFDEFLDFSQHNIVVNQNSIKKYYLCGIITHLGESGSGGHFIAYCRNNPNNNFLCYNDSSVSQVSVPDAMSYKISKKEMEKKTPYILLYHYMNEKK